MDISGGCPENPPDKWAKAAIALFCLLDDVDTLTDDLPTEEKCREQSEITLKQYELVVGEHSDGSVYIHEFMLTLGLFVHIKRVADVE